MLLKAFHNKLTEDREFTYLTAAADAAATTLTVAAIDTTSWVNGDYILIGEFGEETAEIKAINAATSAGTSLTTTAVTFAHPMGTKVYHLNYNQVRFVHSTSDSSTDVDNANLSTIAIEPSNLFTRYEDTTNSTGYGSFRFYNSTTAAFSSYAAFVAYTGYTIKSLWDLRKKVARFIYDDSIGNDDIDDAINDAQREIMHDRLWNFGKIERSLSSVDDQIEYTIPSVINIPNTITWDSQPLAITDQARWDSLHWDTITTGDPTHCCISGTTLKVYPQPTSSASTTTLGAAITTTTATTITVAASSAFRFSPYARFIIDSEVIYATGSTSTTFTSCLRGQEGTTAATHSNGATVTERDIVIFGQKEPTDLVDTTDETDISEPKGVALKASQDLAYSLKGDQVLGDRLKKEYEDWLKGFRKRYSLRLISQSAIVKDASEVVLDNNLRRSNWNDTLDTTSGS